MTAVRSHIASLVYDDASGGHRLRDATVLAVVLDGTTYIAPPRDAFVRLVQHPGPLLWQTADHRPGWFTAVTLSRALRGRRTVGLCYRNNYASSDNALRQSLHRMLFRFWNFLPRCKALSISSHLSDCFVFDTEWWDLYAAPVPAASVPFVKTGKTVMFLGSVDAHKGIAFFISCATAAAACQSNWRFVLIGQLERLSPEQRSQLEGASVVMIAGPREDSKFVSYMREADLLWCCYIPSYDQSSGIFGRALQLEKNTVVRTGSFLETAQKSYGQGFAVAYGDVDALLSGLDATDARPPRTADIAGMYRQTRDRLRRACGLQ